MTSISDAVKELQACARNFLSDGPRPLGEFLAHMKTHEYSSELISRATAALLSHGELALDSRRMIRAVPEGQRQKVLIASGAIHRLVEKQRQEIRDLARQLEDASRRAAYWQTLAEGGPCKSGPLVPPADPWATPAVTRRATEESAE